MALGADISDRRAYSVDLEQVMKTKMLLTSLEVRRIIHL